MATDASALFTASVSVAERFQIVLEKLVRHRRAQSQKSLITQKPGDVLKLDSNIVEGQFLGKSR